MSDYSFHEPLWNGFWEYISRSYEDNARQRAVMQEWYDGLRQRSDLYLDYAQITNQVSGYSFQAYLINQQVVVSEDRAVLTVPFPRSSHDPAENIHTDQLVGAWLHDFGDDEGFLKRAEYLSQRMVQRDTDVVEIKITRLPKILRPYVQKVFNGIQEIGEDGCLPGNKIHTGVLRFQAKDSEQKTATVHRDVGTMRTNRWTRTILHSFFGEGTLYGLDGNAVFSITDPVSIPLRMPAGVTYTHFTSGYDKEHPEKRLKGFEYFGIRHQAPDDPAGRAALVKRIIDGSMEPFEDTPSPWKMEYTRAPEYQRPPLDRIIMPPKVDGYRR